MKIKTILTFSLAAVLLLSSAAPAKAQSGFGIKAGIYTNKLSDLDHFDISNNTGFQAGILYKLQLPAGFALQPELLYIAKNSKLKADNADSRYSGKEKFDMKYIQVPIGLQWGVNLMVIRPYAQVVPYFNYAIGKDFTKGKDWGDIHRANWGIGVGAGIDIWKFQVSGRYNWDFGKNGKRNSSETDDCYEQFKRSKARGLEFSLAFIF